MLVCLTTNASGGTAPPPSVDLVGGKAASLAKLHSTPGLSHRVPKAFALTVAFFRPWIDAISSTEEFANARDAVAKSTAGGDVVSPPSAEVVESCSKLKELCRSASLSDEQREVLVELASEIKSWKTANDGSGGGVAAVRSSAIDEDGAGASFAGAFETSLGVSPSDLEDAVRRCLASVFDFRVFSYMYASARTGANDTSRPAHCLAFAAVVMEMVDSDVAGVCFTANPLNSDRDEMVVDSSWGLGGSVVDGSIEADRCVYCKLEDETIETRIGKKDAEKRLSSDGGYDTKSVDEGRQAKSSLTDAQLKELAKIVGLVEAAYGVPMDVEWAYTSSSGDSSDGLELKLLQARPITALFYLDDNMMTKPGERRLLYYDFNIASDATTTAPFTHMDIAMYSKMSTLMCGIEDWNMFKTDPRMPMINASTRQYINLSIIFRYISPEGCSKKAELLDPYLAAIFASKDCDRTKYRLQKLPKEVSLRNAWWIFRQIPLRRLRKTGKKFKADPEKAKLEYMKIVERDLSKVKQIKERGIDKSKGLQAFADELYEAISPSFFQELGALFFAVLPLFRKLDKKRRDGKTEEIRSEYDALCSGYEGDELMATNIEMHLLATKLPESIWEEYDHDDLGQLAARIRSNLDGSLSDLPPEFLEAWEMFMERFGYDGQDQYFLSSPRYDDNPELLLSKVKHNVGTAVIDPAVTQREQVAKRRAVMTLHEERAKKNKLLHPFALGKVKKRNAYLEHLMWMRNAPKLHFARIYGVLRAEVLRVQNELLRNNRLDEEGDIFHLDLDEVDAALEDESMDIMEIVKPRKAIYQRATRATVCPLLIDSRCRILRPDPPVLDNCHQEGTLIGAGVSPGIATGRVRIIDSPAERFERGEVLATVVTGPAWTPLFVGASAVILQIGGVLQHGALCAREYGKPAVSNIDVHAALKTGMMVKVDGNLGVVEILGEEGRVKIKHIYI